MKDENSLPCCRHRRIPQPRVQSIVETFCLCFSRCLVPTDGDFSLQSPPFNPLFTCFSAHKLDKSLKPPTPHAPPSHLCRVCVAPGFFLCVSSSPALEIQQLDGVSFLRLELWGGCEGGGGCVCVTEAALPPPAPSGGSSLL